MDYRVVFFIFVLNTGRVFGKDWITDEDFLSNPYLALQRTASIAKFVQNVSHSELLKLNEDLKQLDGLNVLNNIREIIRTQPVGREIPEKCADQIVYLGDNINTWGLKVVDSWGKPESGILIGNIKWLGNYDECLSTTINVTTPSAGVPNFNMQYCTADKNVTMQGHKLTIGMGICMPAGCSNTSIISILESLLRMNDTGKNTTSLNVICQVTERKLDSTAVFTVVIVSLITGICLLATLIDVYLILTKPSESEFINTQNGIHSKINSSQEETTPLISKPAQPKQSFGMKMLLCFSLYTNSLKILSTEQTASALPCLHGIRFLSMTWVILGHTGAFSVLSVKNQLQVLEWYDRQSFQVIINATVSVDSFFVLSGLLTAYIMIRDFIKRSTTLTMFVRGLPKLYIHRYIRLTPAYGFVVLIWTCLIWYVNSGPIWPNEGTMDERCQRHWYLNFLYINNLYQSDDNCLGWSWYLANDMQFFIVAPFLIYLMYRNVIAGSVMLFMLALISSITGVIVAYNQHAGVGLNVLIPGIKTGTIYYYYAPWCRFHPYAIGLAAGYFLGKYDRKLPFKMNRVVNMLLYGVSAGLCLSYLYGPYELETNPQSANILQQAVYSSIGRLSFSLGLAYMIIMCCTGYGGIINQILSWSGFIPVSKLTYCAYLIHPIVIWIIVRGTKSTSNYDVLRYVCTFMTYCSLAFLAAFPFSVLFEAPIMALDKLIMSPRVKRLNAESSNS